jgi:hypothetical protein
MVVSVTTVGTGSFKGHITDVGNYQYSEGSMPHDAFDDSGEIGQLSFEAVDDGNSILLYQDTIRLEDSFYGSVTGRVNGFSYSDGFVQITGTSRLNLINTEGIVEPVVTTIPQYIRFILGSASITTDIIIDPSVPRDTITAPGFEGNLWVLLKQFAAVYQLDVSLIRNTVYVRTMRDREIDVESIVEENLDLGEETLSQKFQVAYYNYQNLSNVLAYPFGGWSPEVEVYSVEAGETITFDIPVNAFLDSVKQPIVQNTVAREYLGPDSVYSAIGSDSLPVSAAFWNSFGGRMSFELTDLGRNIRVTLRGPDFPELSPYSIALSDGATEYSTLRIVGSGVFFDRQTLTVPTGLTSVETPQEFGQEIDNVFVDSREQALEVAVKARRKYSLPRQTFQTSGRRLQSGTNDTVLFFPTFDAFDAKLPSPFVFNELDESYETSNFDDFDASEAQPVGQAFGTIAGSRLKFKDAYYRVRTTQVSESGASVSAEYDTLFSDFNEVFSNF